MIEVNAFKVWSVLCIYAVFGTLEVPTLIAGDSGIKIKSGPSAPGNRCAEYIKSLIRVIALAGCGSQKNFTAMTVWEPQN